MVTWYSIKPLFSLSSFQMPIYLSRSCISSATRKRNRMDSWKENWLIKNICLLWGAIILTYKTTLMFLKRLQLLWPYDKKCNYDKWSGHCPVWNIIEGIKLYRACTWYSASSNMVKTCQVLCRAHIHMVLLKRWTVLQHTAQWVYTSPAHCGDS